MQHSKGVKNLLSRQKKSTKLNELQIQTSWALLAAGEISDIEFIDRVKFKVGKINHRANLKDIGLPEGPELKDWLEIESCRYPETAVSAQEENVFDKESSSSEDTKDALTAADESDAGSEEFDVSGEDHTYARFLPDDHTYAKRTNILAIHEQEHHPQSPPLTDKMSLRIKEALGHAPQTVVARVPVSRQTVTRKELATLLGSNWLSDVIINVFLDLIVHRSRGNPQLPSVYVFNSFFFNVLNRMDYDDVKRWTRREDIFAHDILLIPIHQKNHWTMVVVDLRHKVIKYLDSMGGKNDECLKRLRLYLAEEMMAKKDSLLNANEWHLENVLDLPQQENGYDCGVFALKFADYFARDAKINFDQRDIPYFRQRMIYEILMSSLIPPV